MGRTQIRISIYHWIPMADNMLLKMGGFEEGSIEGNLLNSPHVAPNSVKFDGVSSIQYSLLFPIDKTNPKPTRYSIKGSVNNRGFTQHTLKLDMGMEPNSQVAWLRDNVFWLRQFVGELLFEIVPYSVRNNAAVLYERIVSEAKFEEVLFTPSITAPAQKFFFENSIVIATLNDAHRAVLEHSSLPALDIDLPIEGLSENPAQTVSVIGKRSNSILFFSDNYDEEEASEFDGLLYKYAALLIFSRITDLLLSILKETRSYIPPMRRRLAIALQRSDSLVEDFTPFTRISRYLGYISIKLPVIKTMRNYLIRVHGSKEFKAKLDLFDNPAGYERYETIHSIGDAKMTPRGVISLLTDYFLRLEHLFSEDKEEVEIFSEEISRHLNITLSSERARLSARELQASETSRELNRGGKNRSEALKGLSIVTAGSLGLAVATTVGQLFSVKTESFEHFVLSMAFMIGTIGVSWTFINQKIREKSSHFHLAIEVRKKAQAKPLVDFVHSHELKRSDIDGGRRIQTWAQSFTGLTQRGPFGRLRPQPVFDITFDYQLDGLIHSISIECEHITVNFDPLRILIQLFTAMQEAGCLLMTGGTKVPLFAEVLMHLGVSLDDSLPGLNYLLATTTFDLRQRLLTREADQMEGVLHDAEDNQPIFADESYLDDIRMNAAKYIAYIEQVDGTLKSLLGENWLKEKRRMLEDLSPHDSH